LNGKTKTKANFLFENEINRENNTSNHPLLDTLHDSTKAKMNSNIT
jgi:hypothetical protein